jgi:hypothetical protein
MKKLVLVILFSVFVFFMSNSKIVNAADIILTITIKSDNVQALKDGFLDQNPKPINSGLTDKQWIEKICAKFLLKESNEGLDNIAKNASEKLSSSVISISQ